MSGISEALIFIAVPKENLMKLTPGKLAGLKKVSNEHGVIAAAAMDQRGSLHPPPG